MASGKTTLVAKLQGVEEYMKGRGLEYLYFNVHDEDVDGENFDTWNWNVTVFHVAIEKSDFNDGVCSCVASWVCSPLLTQYTHFRAGHVVLNTQDADDLSALSQAAR